MQGLDSNAYGISRTRSKMKAQVISDNKTPRNWLVKPRHKMTPKFVSSDKKQIETTIDYKEQVGTTRNIMKP